MEKFSSVNEILEFAMDAEQEAFEFYTALAEQSKTEDMRKIFIQFAHEEIGHKAKLNKIQEEGVFAFEDENIPDLKISDYTVSAKPTPDMSYQDALVLAMKKEKAAFKLYTALAERVQSGELKQVFLMLAQEESKHKLRFELEYDEHVLREN